jgi:hypothetical protein
LWCHGLRRTKSTSSSPSECTTPMRLASHPTGVVLQTPTVEWLDRLGRLAKLIQAVAKG